MGTIGGSDHRQTRRPKAESRCSQRPRVASHSSEGCLCLGLAAQATRGIGVERQDLRQLVALGRDRHEAQHSLVVRRKLVQANWPVLDVALRTGSIDAPHALLRPPSANDGNISALSLLTGKSLSSSA